MDPIEAEPKLGAAAVPPLGEVIERVEDVVPVLTRSRRRHATHPTVERLPRARGADLRVPHLALVRRSEGRFDLGALDAQKPLHIPAPELQRSVRRGGVNALEALAELRKVRTHIYRWCVLPRAARRAASGHESKSGDEDRQPQTI